MFKVLLEPRAIPRNTEVLGLYVRADVGQALDAQDRLATMRQELRTSDTSLIVLASDVANVDTPAMQRPAYRQLLKYLIDINNQPDRGSVDPMLLISSVRDLGHDTKSQGEAIALLEQLGSQVKAEGEQNREIDQARFHWRATQAAELIQLLTTQADYGAATEQASALFEVRERMSVIVRSI